MAYDRDKALRVQNARGDYDLYANSALEYERQEGLAKTNFISDSINALAGRTKSRIDDITFSNSIQKGPTSLQNLEASDLIPPRAVGPIEHIPLLTTFGSSKRLEYVLTHTQTIAEMELRSKKLKEWTWYDKDGNPHQHTYIRHLDAAPNLGIVDSNYTRGQFSDHRAAIWHEGDDDRELASQYRKADNFYNSANRNLPKPVIDFTFSITNKAIDVYDLRNMKFPAYIRSYNENNSASWDALGFVNAVENSYVYQRGDKSFTLEFTLFVGSEGEVNHDELGWNGVEKSLPKVKSYDIISRGQFGTMLEFLNTLTRARLGTDSTNEDEYNHILAVPFCEMYIGDFINKQMCIIESVALNYDPLIWELKPGKQAPMYVNVALAGRYLFGNPNVYTDYYGKAF